MNRRIKLLGLVLILLVVAGCLATLIINRRMTRPHELGEGRAVIAGPNNCLEIRASGCFLRREEWPTLYFKAISLTPEITIVSHDAPETNVKVVMDNINADSLSVEGGKILEAPQGEKWMTVEAPIDSTPTSLAWKFSRPKESFSFFAFGDNRSQYEVLERIRRDIIRERPLFVVNTGDLASHGREGELLEHEEFAESVPVPYFTVLGNHDLDEGSHEAKYYQRIFGPTFYSFWYGSNLFVVLDNSAGYISLGQMKWCSDELEKSRNATKKIVFAHQPPSDPRRGHHHAMKPLISGASLLQHIFEKGGLDLFVSGHLHSYYEIRDGGILYLITGNAKGGGSEPMPFSHYVVFDIDNNRINRELRLVETEEAEAEYPYP